MKFLIGFTQADPANRDHSPFSDGYAPNDYQIELLLTLPDPLIAEALARDESKTSILLLVAEAIFEATNAPDVYPESSLTRFIQDSLRDDYEGYLRSLSRGDTVSRVATRTEAIHEAHDVHVDVIESVECDSVGWKPIDISAWRNPISQDAYLDMTMLTSMRAV